MKSLRNRKKSILLTALVILMVLAAGCQAVGSVDLNQMLKQSLKVTSFAGSQTLEFKLLTDEQALAAMDKEEAELLRLFSDVKLSLSDLKVQDEEHLSMKGKLELTGRSIGFAASLSGSKAIIEIEGMKKNFSLDLDRLGMDMLGSQQLMNPLGAAESDETLSEAAKKLTDTVSGFVIDHLPNPSGITVLPAQETIGGESLNVMHVAAKLNGEQIYEWLISFLDALVQDKEGLKTLMVSVIDLLESEQSGFGQDIEGLFGTEPGEEANQQEVEDAADEIVQGLTEMKEGLVQAKQEDPEMFEAIFNKNTSVSADLYVDSKLDIRKSVLEGSFTAGDALLAEEELPFTGISVKSTSEISKVNEAVTPDVLYPTPFNTIRNYQLEHMEPYQMLQQIDPASDLYKLLHDDLKVFNQQVMLFPEFGEYEPIETESYITLIPVRHVAEQLGAGVTSTPKGEDVTIYDEATNKTVKFHAGSKQFEVNGEIVPLSYPVTSVNGVTYVAARDFVKVFGGKVYWNYEDYEDFKYLVIEREF